MILYKLKVKIRMVMEQIVEISKITDFKELVKIAGNIEKPELQLAAVQRCRKLMSEPDPATDDMIESGFLRVLVQLLSRADSSDLHYDAVWIVANIISRIPAQSEKTQVLWNIANISSRTITQSLKTKVIEAGAVPALIELLKSPRDDVCEQAVCALGDIIDGDKELRHRVIELGVLEPLVSFVKRNISTKFLQRVTHMIRMITNQYGLFNFYYLDQKAIEQVVSALNTLITFRETSIVTETLNVINNLSSLSQVLPMITKPGIATRLVSLVSHEDEQVRAAAVRAIEHIVCNTSTEDQRQVVVDCGLLSHLSAALSRQNYSALNTLSTFAASNEDQKQAVVDAGFLPRIAEFLSMRSNYCETAVKILANIAVGNERQKQAVVDALLPRIADILNKQVSEIDIPAAALVCNLVNDGTAEQVSQLVSSGVIPPLCNLLTHEDKQVVANILDSLSALLGAAGEDAEAAAGRIRECGGVEKIRALLSVGNRCVKVKAESLLELCYSLTGSSSSGAGAAHAQGPIFRGPSFNFTFNTEAQEIPKITDFKQLVKIAGNIEKPELQLAAVQRCRKLMSETDPRTDDMIESGFLRVLVQLLSRADSSVLHYDAVWIVANITSSLKTKVIEAGTVPALIELLKSPRDDVCEQAVCALGNIIDDDKELRNRVIELGAVEPLVSFVKRNISTTFLQRVTNVIGRLCMTKTIPQIIPALKKLMTCSESNIITETLTVINNLSWYTQGIRMILESDIAAKLVTLVSHENEQVQAAAVSAVWRILFHAETNDQRQVVVDCGLLSHLPAALAHQNRGIYCDAFSALELITGYARGRHAVVDAGFLPRIVELLDHKNDNICFGAVITLSRFATGNEHLKQSVVDAGLLPRIAELLSIANDFICKRALSTLSTIAAGNKYQRAVVDAGLLPRIAELLSTRSDDFICKHAVKTLANIAVGNDRQKQDVVDALLPRIADILNKQVSEINIPAAALVCNLVNDGTAEQVSQLVSSGVIPPLCNLLTHEDKQFVAIILDSLSALLGAAGEDAKVAAGRIRECGGVEKIRALLSVGNRRVEVKANILLKLYSSITGSSSSGAAATQAQGPMFRGPSFNFTFNTEAQHERTFGVKRAATSCGATPAGVGHGSFGGSGGLFGTKPATTGCGATQTSTGLDAKPATTGFGASPASLGLGTFGGGGTVFGAKPATTDCGATQTSTGLGAFGGGGGLFGSKPATTDCGATQTSTGLDAKPATTGFGASPASLGLGTFGGGGTIFGAKPATTGFGASPASFGLGAFGGGGTLFGAKPATTGCGATQTSTGLDAFGGGGGLFGSKPATTDCGATQTSTGLGAFGGGGGLFGSKPATTDCGATQTSTGLGAFGGGGGLFGSKPATTDCGATQTSTGLDAKPATTGFGAAPASLGLGTFGGGGTIFGAKPATTGFGASPASFGLGAFGGGGTLFGAKPATTGCGATQTSTGLDAFGGGGGLFGSKPATTDCGATQTSTGLGAFGGGGGLFGSKPATTDCGATQTSTGLGAFGGGGGLFGSKPATTDCGATQTSTGLGAFGGGGGLFGSKPATTDCGATQTSTGLDAKPATTGFGAAPASTGLGAFGGGGTVFGAKTATTGFGAAPASTGLGAFGGGGGLFGSKPATTGCGATQTSTGLDAKPATTSFGAAPASTGLGAFGGGGTVFGAKTSTTGFGAAPASTGLGAFGGGGGLFGSKPATTGCGATQTSTGLYAKPATTGFGAAPASTGLDAKLATTSCGTAPANTGLGGFASGGGLFGATPLQSTAPIFRATAPGTNETSSGKTGSGSEYSVKPEDVLRHGVERVSIRGSRAEEILNQVQAAHNPPETTTCGSENSTSNPDSEHPSTSGSPTSSSNSDPGAQDKHPQTAYTDAQVDAVRRVIDARNSYDVLGVPASSDLATIEAAHTQLKKLLHPDKNKAPGSRIRRRRKRKEQNSW